MRKRSNDNVNPFTKAESHFTDSKFFEEGTAPKETTPYLISSTGKGEPKAAKNSKMILRHDGMEQQEYCKGDGYQEVIAQLVR